MQKSWEKKLTEYATNVEMQDGGRGMERYGYFRIRGEENGQGPNISVWLGSLNETCFVRSNCPLNKTGYADPADCIRDGTEFLIKRGYREFPATGL
jgi:hypothetical protein